jgi:hypothetical protein
MPNQTLLLRLLCVLFTCTVGTCCFTCLLDAYCGLHTTASVLLQRALGQVIATTVLSPHFTSRHRSPTFAFTPRATDYIAKLSSSFIHLFTTRCSIPCIQIGHRERAGSLLVTAKTTVAIEILGLCRLIHASKKLLLPTLPLPEIKDQLMQPMANSYCLLAPVIHTARTAVLFSYVTICTSSIRLNMQPLNGCFRSKTDPTVVDGVANSFQILLRCGLSTQHDT